MKKKSNKKIYYNDVHYGIIRNNSLNNMHLRYIKCLDYIYSDRYNLSQSLKWQMIIGELVYTNIIKRNNNRIIILLHILYNYVSKLIIYHKIYMQIRKIILKKKIYRFIKYILFYLKELIYKKLLKILYSISKYKEFLPMIYTLRKILRKLVYYNYIPMKKRRIKKYKKKINVDKKKLNIFLKNSNELKRIIINHNQVNLIKKTEIDIKWNIVFIQEQLLNIFGTLEGMNIVIQDNKDFVFNEYLYEQLNNIFGNTYNCEYIIINSNIDYLDNKYIIQSDYIQEYINYILWSQLIIIKRMSYISSVNIKLAIYYLIFCYTMQWLIKRKFNNMYIIKSRVRSKKYSLISRIQKEYYLIQLINKLNNIVLNNKVFVQKYSDV